MARDIDPSGLLSGKLATTYLESGPLEELMSVDAYNNSSKDGVDSTGGINPYADGGSLADGEGDSRTESFGLGGTDSGRKSKSVFSDFLSSLKGGSKFNAKDIVDAINVEDGKISFDNATFNKRMSGVLGGSSGPLTRLAADLRESMISNLAKWTGKDNDTIRLAIGDTLKILNSDDKDSATGIFDLLKIVSGSSAFGKLFDIEAELAMFDTILNELIKWGVPEAIDEFLAKIEDDKTRRKVMLANLRISAMRTELHYIRKCVGYVGSAGCLSRVPDLVVLILKYYHWKIGTKGNEYPGLLAELINTLDLVDPDWRYIQVGDQLMYNLEPFCYASTQARTLLAISDESLLVTSSLVGKDWPVMDIAFRAKQYYGFG